MKNNLLEKIRSKKRTEILDGLYEIGSIADRGLSPNEVATLLSLMRHRDADIREQAVSVASIHYRIEESYFILVSMLSGDEQDQSVLTTVCTALGSMVAHGLGDPRKASSLLAQIALNSDLDPELRGEAYLSLLRIHKRISVADFAKSTRDVEDMDFDAEWVLSQAGEQ